MDGLDWIGFGLHFLSFPRRYESSVHVVRVDDTASHVNWVTWTLPLLLPAFEYEYPR